MFYLLASIQRSKFPRIIFLLKSEWNRLGNCPASDLKFSSADVIDMEYTYNIPYIQRRVPDQDGLFALILWYVAKILYW